MPFQLSAGGGILRLRVGQARARVRKFRGPAPGELQAVIGIWPPAPIFPDLPAMADALSSHGFAPDDICGVLGGNYARVFRASLGGGGEPAPSWA